MLRRLFLVAVALFSLNASFSQKSIGIDSVGYNVPTNVSPHVLYTFQVRLLNKGSVPFTDTINMHAAVDSSGNSTFIIFHNWSKLVTFSVFGDTASTGFTDTVSVNQGFRSGINTVVIWPQANDTSIHTHDSLFVSVYFDTTSSGINNADFPAGFMMYPNPAKDVLYFNPLTPKHPYRKIKVYDLNGRLILQTDFKKQIDISFLETGMYTVAVETLSGEQKKIKFLKE